MCFNEKIIFSTLFTYYPGTKKHNYATTITTNVLLLATTVTLVDYIQDG